MDLVRRKGILEFLINHGMSLQKDLNLYKDDWKLAKVSKDYHGLRIFFSLSYTGGDFLRSLPFPKKMLRTYVDGLQVDGSYPSIRSSNTHARKGRNDYADERLLFLRLETWILINSGFLMHDNHGMR